MNKRFFIPLVPSTSENQKLGSPTHYAKHRGVEKLDWRIAAHIAREVNRGNAEPELFICAWRDPHTDAINLGLEVPRSGDVSTLPLRSPSEPEELPRSTLAHLFD